jgi:hypothetical protein
MDILTACDVNAVCCLPFGQMSDVDAMGTTLPLSLACLSPLVPVFCGLADGKMTFL